MRSLTHLAVPLFGVTLVTLGATGCATEPSVVESQVANTAIPADVAESLARLPAARVLATAADGVPTALAGTLGQIGALEGLESEAAEARLRSALADVVAPFRVVDAQLMLRKVNVDDTGSRHFRFQYQHGGLDVIGSQLVVHVDADGEIFGVDGTARGEVSTELGATAIDVADAQRVVAGDSRFGSLGQGDPKLVYVQSSDGVVHHAYEIEASGQRDGEPARDKVYVDAVSGAIVAVHPQIHFARTRRVYSAGTGTTLPGTLRLTEGGTLTADAAVNEAYQGTGYSYDAYKQYFNRDSWNGIGGQLVSTVHFDQNLCNAFWNGTQMSYGDGDPTIGCNRLTALDVTAHELTHAVTETESGLVYAGESGGLNEAMSDIFASFVEAWVDGGANGALSVTPKTWIVGEDVILGGLRLMCDPSKDGDSLDYWTPNAKDVDVHYSSGIANLAFCMLTQGGVHPTGRSTVKVQAIGMDKAIRIFYSANSDYLTPNATFLAARTATVSAAEKLGYDKATVHWVHNAWAAVGVGPVVTNNAPTATLTEPANGAEVDTSFMVKASVVDTDPAEIVKGELFVDGQLVQTVMAPPYEFQVSGLTGGGHSVQIKATDSIDQTSEQTINVMVIGAKGVGAGDKGGGKDSGTPNEVVGGCAAGGAPGGLVSALASSLLLLGGLRRRRR